MCPENPWWNDIPGKRCQWLANELSQQYNLPLNVLMQKNVGELELLYATGNLNNMLNNAAILPRLFYENPQIALQALQQYNSGCQSYSYGVGLAYNPNFAYRSQSNQGGIAAVFFIIGGILIGYTAAGAISRSQSSIATASFEYRLTGFKDKVGTLAEHLAKALNKEVAGYPKPDPNPDDRATRGWCITIRRVIQEIDRAGYTEKQLARDLEKAGMSQEIWSGIKTAAKAAAEGPCKDDWGDFTGGSLAAG